MKSMTLAYTIDNLGEKQSLQIAENISRQKGYEWIEAVKVVFQACIDNPELTPKIRGKTSDNTIHKWLTKYWKGYRGRISSRVSNSPGTVADPMVGTIIGTRLPYLTDKDLERIKYAHRVSMSAENILGLLLEEYLADNLQSFGWYCTWGDTVRSVDFCHTDGRLLQVKNRSNSENSSSMRVREGTEITKWHRVDARTGNYKWHELNTIYTTNFSENAFREFVIQTLKNNPNALPIERENFWH